MTYKNTRITTYYWALTIELMMNGFVHFILAYFPTSNMIQMVSIGFAVPKLSIYTVNQKYTFIENERNIIPNYCSVILTYHTLLGSAG